MRTHGRCGCECSSDRVWSFMPVGVLLGPTVLGFIGTASLGLLDPLLNLVITWVGLVMGLQLRLRDLKRIPASDWRASLLQFSGTVALVTLGSWPLLLWLHAPDPLALALLLGCLAGSSSATMITLALSGAGLARGQRARTAILYSNLDGMYALFLLGLVSILLLPHKELASGLPLPLTLLIPPLVSLALAWVFHYFLERALRDSQLILLLIGLLTFAGGCAAIIKFSPLVMGLLMGLWLTNQSRRANQLYEFMIKSEWPIMLALILMGGLLWHPVRGAGCWLLLVLVVLRTIAKVAGWQWTVRVRSLPEWTGTLSQRDRRRLRFVLLPMGGVSACYCAFTAAIAARGQW